MKKLLTRLILILLIATISLPLVSCGAKSYNPDNFLENGTESNPYQIFKEKDTLKVFVISSAAHLPFKELESWKYISELTNINFDWIEADLGTYRTIRSTQWENKKNLPDLFLFMNSIEEQEDFAKKNALIAMDDKNLEIPVEKKYGGTLKVGSLIENFMPNYNAFLKNNFNVDEEKYGNAKDISTISDGNIYSLLRTNYEGEGYKFYLNNDWIDNLNNYYGKNFSYDPKTLDELIEIFRAFKQYDANRNGQVDDEIPMSYSNIGLIADYFMSCYGYVDRFVEIDLANSENIVYVPQTTQYREMLKTLNMLYREKLIDNSIFDTTSALYQGKGYAGRLGSFPDAAAFLAVGTDREDEYDALAPVVDNKVYSGEAVIRSGGRTFIPDLSLIPKGTKKVREVARLLDMMYTEEMSMVMGRGVEGKHWDWEDKSLENKYFNKDAMWKGIIPPGFQGNSETFRGTISNSVGTGLSVYVNPVRSDVNMSFRCNDELVKRLQGESKKYIPHLKHSLPIGFSLNNQEDNAVSLIKGSLDSYVENYLYLFTKGEKDPNNDADWNAYVQYLKKSGSDTLAEYYNTAYNRIK